MLTKRGVRKSIAMAAATMSFCAMAMAVPHAASADSPYEKGPDPTEQALEREGPFRTASVRVSDFAAPGFGGGTIYYPTDDSQGTYGGVVVFPGFTASRSTMAWLAQRIASHGFVVLNADTNSVWDQPGSRGNQMLDAIDYLRDDSAVSDRVDGSRIGVTGHSMGGGGALEAISDDSSIDAAVPLTPWNLDTTWREVDTPTMIIGAENDLIASVAIHSIPMYNGLSSSLDRAYVELNGSGHLAPNVTNSTISRYTVAWMKRYVDDDERYTSFACTDPGFDLDLSDYRSDCS